jgi:TatD DNase family protein
MIDSHCHLDQPPLEKNIKDVLSRSKEIGIEKLLTISTTSNSFKKILTLVEYDPIIYGTFGIHPHESDKEFFSIENIIKKFSINKKIIGIGETGLDFYYNNSIKEKQISSFRNHIEASIKLKVPLIVHSRNAEKETFDLLNEYKDYDLKILMHCFTGSMKFAEKLLKLNTYFSASGIITFKNSIDLQNTFKKIPLEKLLIETDSPFLAPYPMRGKKNEPSFIKFTLKKLSELKNTDLNYLDKITTSNFNKLFF